MRYIFFGTPDFAAIILERLIKAGFPPAGVVCNPDKPFGRKKIITAPPTKIIAQKYNIPVLQLESLKIEDWKLEIGEIDFAVVAAYAKIIPKEFLGIPPLGTIGVHPSLLPKYRGPSPIQSAILNGELETGISLFLVDERTDHGPLLAQRQLKIQNLNYEELNIKLAELGAELLIETLPKFLKSEVTPLPQDESKTTYTQKFITEEGYVDLQKDNPIIIERKIRALNPEPGVWTFEDINGKKKRVKLLEGELIDRKLKLTKIQIEGKKPQPASIILSRK